MHWNAISQTKHNRKHTCAHTTRTHPQTTQKWKTNNVWQPMPKIKIMQIKSWQIVTNSPKHKCAQKTRLHSQTAQNKQNKLCLTTKQTPPTAKSLNQMKSMIKQIDHEKKDCTHHNNNSQQAANKDYIPRHTPMNPNFNHNPQTQHPKNEHPLHRRKKTTLPLHTCKNSNWLGHASTTWSQKN